MTSAAILLTCWLSLTGLTGHQEPKPILSVTDIDRLINTYKPLMSDLENLGTKIKNKKDPNLLMGYAASDEAASIFRRHGWDEAFFKNMVSSRRVMSICKQRHRLRKCRIRIVTICVSRSNLTAQRLKAGTRQRP